MNNKYLICVGLTESHEGAIRFISQQIEKHPEIFIEVFLFTAVPKDKNMSFFGTSDNESDNQEMEKKILNIKNKIQNTILSSNFSILYEIYSGDFSDGVKEKLLNDKSINLVIMGASQTSLGKGKTINKLIEKIHDILTIPFIVIPQNITDEQISRILL